MLKDHRKLIYPSGSAIEFYKNRLWVMGDDATHLLALDPAFHPIDSIRLFEGSNPRIDKSIKHDLESMAIIRPSSLLIAGSGSIAATRSKGFVLDLESKDTALVSLARFYERLEGHGIESLNIEGMATVTGGFFILANRGNKAYPRNHLVFTSRRFWERQDSVPIRLVRVGTNTDTASFTGVSGLCYSSKSDILFLTVTTENTRNAYEDGTIGKSYLWIIRDISAKRRFTAINPNRVVDLERLNAAFAGKKVESICIIFENEDKWELALVADDDLGNTELFRIELRKE